MDTVGVGNPGNPADGGVLGNVAYAYRIGKYEVTNNQYTAFLNAVDPTGANSLALYNGSMTSSALGGINFSSGAAAGSKYSVKSGRGQNPVVFVSWYDGIRFANWMHNNQGGPGSTESGAYSLLGGTPVPSNSTTIARDPGYFWALPTTNEWYKAGMHKNDGVTGNYWNYAVQTDSLPDSDQPPGTGAPNSAHVVNDFRNDSLANGYNDGYAVTGSITLDPNTNYLTDVGAYSSAVSAYGTFDQNGNVNEWMQNIGGSPFFQRSFRGGGWGGSGDIALTGVSSGGATTEQENLGFRLITVVPEANSLVFTGSLAAMALAYGQRRILLGALRRFTAS
jgi:formylglycine-generating enzyme required for sulfatase activity